MFKINFYVVKKQRLKIKIYCFVSVMQKIARRTSEANLLIVIGKSAKNQAGTEPC